MKQYLKIHPLDNVIVAVQALKKGTELVLNGGEKLVLLEDIAPGHKIALKDMAAGENIVKYGVPVGHLTQDVRRGEWIHVHNCTTNLEHSGVYEYKPRTFELPYEFEDRTFNGYVRENGQVGIRNELWIVPTVGCVNGMAQRMIDEFIRRYDPQGLDYIGVVKHPYGCSQVGEDLLNTRHILGGLTKNPNAGGVLGLSLGCEENIFADYLESLGDYNKERIKFLQCQEVGDEVEEGVRILKELYDHMKDDVRTPVPLSELKVGLKCGGSDGFSGITANPLQGEFSDWLVTQGGTTILSEVPEMFGAEKRLMERAVNEEVFQKIVDLINNFKKFFLDHGIEVGENPTPGNRDGGLTTNEDKSQGSTQKGGNSPVVDVLDYGDIVQKHGLHLIRTPGNDIVSSTALAAAGCQLVMFSTGRGTPYGTVVPTVKLATNPKIAAQKPHWIDFNAAKLLEDGAEREDVIREYIEYILSVANGEKTRNELNGFREISIYKTGILL